MTSLPIAPVDLPADPSTDPTTDLPTRRELSAYLAAATRMARLAAKRYDTVARTNGMIGSADLASEGLLAMREAEVAGRWPTSPTGFLKAVIASKAATLGSTISAEDRRAIKLLHALQAEEEAALGRLLTSAERDVLAARVRETWEDRRHLPSADFAAKVGADYLASLDSPASPGHHGATLADVLLEQRGATGPLVQPGCDAVSEHTAAGDAMERWLASSDSQSEEFDARRAWSLAYNAYAELTGAPAVERHLSESAAARVRKQVTVAGGAGELAERWWTGDLSAAEESALFAPLGPSDEDQRRRFVDALLRRPGGAGIVWNLAIRAATRRRG